MLTDHTQNSLFPCLVIKCRNDFPTGSVKGDIISALTQHIADENSPEEAKSTLKPCLRLQRYQFTLEKPFTSHSKEAKSKHSLENVVLALFKKAVFPGKLAKL
jgi:hypothetical protein